MTNVQRSEFTEEPIKKIDDMFEKIININNQDRFYQASQFWLIH